jgi:hypothetical protein
MGRSDWHKTAQEAMALGRVWIAHRNIVNDIRDHSATQTRTNEEVAYDILAKQVEIQHKAGDALDLKIGTFFSIPTLLLPVAAALLIAERDNLGWPGGLLAFLGTVAYGLVLSYLIRGYRADVFFFGPKPDELLTMIETPGFRPEDVLYMIVDNQRKAYDLNAPLLAKKARMLSRALIQPGSHLVSRRIVALRNRGDRYSAALTAFRRTSAFPAGVPPLITPAGPLVVNGLWSDWPDCWFTFAGRFFGAGVCWLFVFVLTCFLPSNTSYTKILSQVFRNRPVPYSHESRD